MFNKVNVGGKFLVAAACAASLAQIPLATISAYSQDYAPSFATTLGIRGTDYILDSIATSDGGVIVVGGGEIQANSAKDSAIIAKYSADGTKAWGIDLGGQSESHAAKIISLANGNYLVFAIIDGENRLVEVSPDGNEVSNTPINQELTGIANTTASSDSVASIVGVDGKDSIYILHKNDSETTGGFSVTMATNIQDGIPIHLIKEYGDGGYVAIGFDESKSKSIIYTANGKADYPDINDIQSEGFHINDVVPYGNSFIAVGIKDGKMHIAKISSEGAILSEYTIDGENTSDTTSQLTSVEVMPNGEIVTVGSSNYSSTSAFTPKGGQDGIIARFNSSLSPISIRSYSGSGYDALNTVTVDGENFYVGGVSGSSDMGIDFVGNELYSIISHFKYGTDADVTFHIDGDLPEGVDAPKNGEYHWSKDGSSNLPIPANTDDAIFSGWYTDQDMKNALGGQTPSSDLDLYGTYTSVSHDLVEDNFDTLCKTVGSKQVCTAPEGYEVSAGETTDPIIPQVPDYDYTGLTGKWVSDDESIATVDQKGRVTGISEGTTTIRYILSDEDGNVVYEYIMSFTVKAATNPDTVDVLPLILAVSAFSFASFSLVATRVFKRR